MTVTRAQVEAAEAALRADNPDEASWPTGDQVEAIIEAVAGTGGSDPNMPLVAGVLNDAQQSALAFWQGYNVPASYFIGVPNADGSVEVIAIGADSPAETFIWSFRISAEGETSTSEATVGEFSTGIDI